MQLSTRSYRTRETSPLQCLGAPVSPTPLPGRDDASSSLQHPQANLGVKEDGVSCRVGRHSRGSLHRASFQAQRRDESFSDHRTAPSSKKSLLESTPLWQLASEEGTGQTNLSESNLPLQHALEEGPRQKLQEQVPPPTQLWHFMLQLRNEIANLHQVVGNLAGLLDSQLRNHSLAAELSKEKGEPTTNNKNNNNEANNNNTNNTNHNHTNNNNDDNNDDNDNNKNSRESSLRSLDLDSENPESNLSGSEPDLDASSLGSFVLGVESGLGSSDQHDEAWSLNTLGHPTLTVESSLASLDQHAKEESSDSFDQEGETIGTEKDPSLTAWASGLDRDSFGNKKPKKRVTFEEAPAAYNKQKQNKKKHKKNNKDSLKDELPEENNKRTTTQPCWNQLQQKQKMQQQPATACVEKKMSLGQTTPTAWMEKNYP